MVPGPYPNEHTLLTDKCDLPLVCTRPSLPEDAGCNTHTFRATSDARHPNESGFGRRMYCTQRRAEPFEQGARVIRSGHIEVAVVSRIHGFNRPDLEMNTCRNQIAHTVARTERNHH